MLRWTLFLPCLFSLAGCNFVQAANDPYDEIDDPGTVTVRWSLPAGTDCQTSPMRIEVVMSAKSDNTRIARCEDGSAGVSFRLSGGEFAFMVYGYDGQNENTHAAGDTIWVDGDGSYDVTLVKLR